MAGLFNFFGDFKKAGPGIEKDVPPKKGLPLLFETVRREWWSLIKLDLLFLLFCIPVITIGPAMAAMTKVTLTMVRDRPIDLWYDFKKAFRENFRQGLAAGLILTVVAGAISFTTYIYLLNLARNGLMLVLLAFNLTSLLLFLLASLYVYPQVVMVSLPILTILKNAWLLGISCLKHSLPALMAIAALSILPFVFPQILPLLLLVYFSSSALIASLAVWPDIQKHIAAPQHM